MPNDLSVHDALFLDLDGTVIDIASTPDGVVTPEALVANIGRLMEHLGGAVAIVTGRPIRDVDRLLAPMVPVAAGVHGSEIRILPQGDIVLLAAPIDVDIVQAVRSLVEAHDGVLVETKRASVAVHYRQSPALASALEASLTRLLEDGPEHLMLAHGRHVLEIVSRQVSKGRALEAIMRLPTFAGRRPIMIGDDVPDVSAFEAAVRLGGMGWKVAGEHFSDKDADFSGPAEVRGWLSAMADMAERSSRS